MKPYGMTRQDVGDTDVAGCRENGRKTSAYAVTHHDDRRAYRSLRNGKKARIRRHAKRIARKANKNLCNQDD